jgi:hypothetical protein
MPASLSPSNQFAPSHEDWTRSYFNLCNRINERTLAQFGSSDMSELLARNPDTRLYEPSDEGIFRRDMRPISGSGAFFISKPHRFYLDPLGIKFDSVETSATGTESSSNRAFSVEHRLVSGGWDRIGTVTESTGTREVSTEKRAFVRILYQMVPDGEVCEAWVKCVISSHQSYAPINDSTVRSDEPDFSAGDIKRKIANESPYVRLRPLDRN